MTSIPNFFIVGTPKSGTTSLFHYLENHPEVFVPKIKEPHFFSCPEVKNTYYKAKIVDSQKAYLDLYETENHYKAVGDFSSSYLYNKNSAKRIKEFNPEAKIIVVIRNPIDRALSHYLMDLNLGYIDKTLIDVIQNKDKYEEHYKQYIELGFYHTQLEKFKQQFNDSQIKVILSEALYNNTDQTLKDIFNFLGISVDYKPDFEKKYNQFNQPRFKFIKRITQSTSFKNIFPSTIKNVLKKIIYKQNVEKPKLEEERQLLKGIYLNSIIKTENMIHEDLSLWKQN